METNFSKVKNFLLELEYNITTEDKEDEVFVIENEEEGIKNMVLVVADPILIIEQQLIELKSESNNVFKELLIKNRDIIHGALVLDETGKKVIFRDTLQLGNLNQNELEASIDSLSLLLSEYTDEIIEFAK